MAVNHDQELNAEDFGVIEAQDVLAGELPTPPEVWVGDNPADRAYKACKQLFEFLGVADTSVGQKMNEIEKEGA